MVARGLREPLLIVTDGNPGVLKAMEEVFPRSMKHAARNIGWRTSWQGPEGSPRRAQGSHPRVVPCAELRARAEQGPGGDCSVPPTISERDEVHGGDPRSLSSGTTTSSVASQAASNREPARRTFGEHRRRTKVIPHFFTEEAAMKLSYAVLLAVANKWRRVRMDVFTARKVEELRNKLLPQLTSKESAA